MTAAFILTGLRAKKENLASIYQGVRVMHESTAYDEAVEEGFVKANHRVLLKLNDLARSWECGTPQRAFPTDFWTPRIVQGHLGRKLLGPANPSVESVLVSIQDVERLETSPCRSLNGGGAIGKTRKDIEERTAVYTWRGQE